MDAGERGAPAAVAAVGGPTMERTQIAPAGAAGAIRFASGPGRERGVGPLPGARAALCRSRAPKTHFMDQNPIATPPGAMTIAVQPMPPGSGVGGNMAVAPFSSALE